MHHLVPMGWGGSKGGGGGLRAGRGPAWCSPFKRGGNGLEGGAGELGFRV